VSSFQQIAQWLMMQAIVLNVIKDITWTIWEIATFWSQIAQQQIFMVIAQHVIRDFL
jgi:hypothetical protein